MPLSNGRGVRSFGRSASRRPPDAATSERSNCREAADEIASASRAPAVAATSTGRIQTSASVQCRPGDAPGTRCPKPCGVPERGHGAWPAVSSRNLVLVEEAAQDRSTPDPATNRLGTGDVGRGGRNCSARCGRRMLFKKVTRREAKPAVAPSAQALPAGPSTGAPSYRPAHRAGEPGRASTPRPLRLVRVDRAAQGRVRLPDHPAEVPPGRDRRDALRFRPARARAPGAPPAASGAGPPGRARRRRPSGTPARPPLPSRGR